MDDGSDGTRRSPDERMTTSAAARLLGISIATVKRWAAANLLRSEHTPGGHRRFRREDVERTCVRLQAGGDSLDRWIERLLEDPERAAEAALHLERARLGSWVRVAEALGPLIRRIGDAWASGALCVLEEHVSSARLARALSRCCEPFEPRRSAPRVLLGTPPGEEHTLGLSLVELCMRERGWRAIWSGAELPTVEFVSAAQHGSIDAIALSASLASAPENLAQVIESLWPVCRNAGVRLLVGGEGPWPEAGGARIERTFRGLERWMVDLESSAAEPPAHVREHPARLEGELSGADLSAERGGTDGKAAAKTGELDTGVPRRLGLGGLPLRRPHGR